MIVEQKTDEESGEANDDRPLLVIIGLGNPILGDDGVGWRVAERVERRIQTDILPDDRPDIGRDIRVECSGAGGLSLMERLIGCSRAIVIDAIVTGTRPPGTVTTSPLDDLPTWVKSYTASSHDVTLKDALEIARRLNVKTPERVDVVAIEISPTYTFSEQLSERVCLAVPAAEQMVMDIIFEDGRQEIP